MWFKANSLLNLLDLILNNIKNQIIEWRTLIIKSIHLELKMIHNLKIFLHL